MNAFFIIILIICIEIFACFKLCSKTKYNCTWFAILIISLNVLLAKYLL